MSTFVDLDCPWETTACTANETARCVWPDKMLRTYLWTLAVEAESSLSGYESHSGCDYDHFPLDSRSSIRIWRFSLGPSYEMADNSLSPVDRFNRHRNLSQRNGTLSTPRLRHFASCDTGLHQSLPVSPRHPRLARSRTPTRYPMTEYPRWNIEPLSMAHAAFQATSHVPTIKLSPSSPDSSNTSFVSTLFSMSASNYPSAPASTASDGYTSTSSESSRSTSSETQLLAEYDRVVEDFRKLTPEYEFPFYAMTEVQYKFVRRQKLDEIVVLLDLTKYLTTVSPGRHGWAVAKATTSTNNLGYHSKYSVEGNNVFLRWQDRTSGQMFYQYCGFYIIMDGASCGFRGQKHFGGRRAENPNLFFFKLHENETRMFSIVSGTAIPQVGVYQPSGRSGKGNTSNDGSSNAEVRQRTTSAGSRIVTVDNVDFEMEDSPVAWDHGSYRG